jgi:hypothetical protein
MITFSLGTVFRDRTPARAAGLQKRSAGTSALRPVAANTLFTLRGCRRRPKPNPGITRTVPGTARVHMGASRVLAGQCGQNASLVGKSV